MLIEGFDFPFRCSLCGRFIKLEDIGLCTRSENGPVSQQIVPCLNYTDGPVDHVKYYHKACAESQGEE